LSSAELREIVCIECPTGCRAKVTMERGTVIGIENAECNRGEDYVRQEATAPMRDFFTTVRLEGASLPVLPVRTSSPIPRGRIMDCSRELAKVTVTAPVGLGEVISKNILGLGVDVVATRSMPQAHRG